jgi:hypothetical protein
MDQCESRLSVCRKRIRDIREIRGFLQQDERMPELQSTFIGVNLRLP